MGFAVIEDGTVTWTKTQEVNLPSTQRTGVQCSTATNAVRIHSNSTASSYSKALVASRAADAPFTPQTFEVLRALRHEYSHNLNHNIWKFFFLKSKRLPWKGPLVRVLPAALADKHRGCVFWRQTKNRLLEPWLVQLTRHHASMKCLSVQPHTCRAVCVWHMWCRLYMAQLKHL